MCSVRDHLTLLSLTIDYSIFLKMLALFALRASILVLIIAFSPCWPFLFSVLYRKFHFFWSCDPELGSWMQLVFYLYFVSRWSHSVLLTTNIIYSLMCSCAQPLQPCLTLCYPMDCRLPGSSVHGILQTRILEWVAMPSSRGSYQPKDWTCISCINKWIFYPLIQLGSPV